MGDECIKSNVNLREFEKCAADRTPMATITAENGATITRMGMDGKVQTVDASAGDKIYKGDIIKTSSDGYVAMVMKDNMNMSGGPNASIDMGKWDTSRSAPQPEDNGVRRGSVSVISGKIAKASPETVNWNYSRFSGPVRG